MVFGNPNLARDIVLMDEAREKYKQQFIGLGEDFTKGYLSAYTGLSKFLREHDLWGDCNRYHGAKRALEEMLKAEERE